MMTWERGEELRSWMSSEVDEHDYLLKPWSEPILCPLIPYPPRYKVAFAFSIFLYPHFHWSFLRSSYLLPGEVWAYHVPRTYPDGLGSACSPMVLCVYGRRIQSACTKPCTFWSSLSASLARTD